MADDEAVNAIRELLVIEGMRQQGRMEAALEEEPKFILVAHYVYPNGTTGEIVTHPDHVRTIQLRMGLRDPDDPAGFGIWWVPETDDP